MLDLSQYDTGPQPGGSEAQGYARGVLAERARIKAILNLPESAFNPSLSRQLALETGMPVPEVQAALRAGGTPPSQGAASADSGTIGNGWDEIIGEMNDRHARTQGRPRR